MNQLRKVLILTFLATSIVGLSQADELDRDALDMIDPFSANTYNLEGFDIKIKKAFVNIFDELRTKFESDLEDLQTQFMNRLQERRNNLQNFVNEDLGSEVRHFAVDFKNAAINAAELSDVSKLTVKIDQFADTVQNKLAPKVIARLEQTKDSVVENLPKANKELTAASGRIRSFIASSFNKNLGSLFPLKLKDIPQTLGMPMIFSLYFKNIIDFYKLVV